MQPPPGAAQATGMGLRGLLWFFLSGVVLGIVVGALLYQTGHVTGEFAAIALGFGVIGGALGGGALCVA